MALPRPCLGCGESIQSGSRCADCAPRRPAKPSATSRGYDYRWQQLSKRVRRASPFCEQCGNTADLTADHVIPKTEAPELRLEPLNVRVLCRKCNGDRGDKCTDAERQAVRDAIAKRKQRNAQLYAAMHQTAP